MGPRTAQASILTGLSLLPRTPGLPRNSMNHALEGSPASVVADQGVPGWKLGNTLAGTNGGGSVGSRTLSSSTIEGSRQPDVPPITFCRHCRVASCHVPPLFGASSHTRPVLLSSTASLLNCGRTVKREALGRLLSQLGSGMLPS